MSTYTGINNERRRAFSAAQERAAERERAVERYIYARSLGFTGHEARKHANLPDGRRA